MATATYSDFMARNPDSTASQATVEAYLDDIAAEIRSRCIMRGTTYEALVERHEGLVRRIECAAAGRICGRGSVRGVSQNGLKSFSQTVGDHSWDYQYAASGGNTLLLNAEWKALGLLGQQMGWLNVPYSGDVDG